MGPPLLDHLHHLVPKLPSLAQRFFWPIWLVTAGFSAACAAWLCRPSADSGKPAPPGAAGRNRFRLASVPVLLLAFFLAIYIAVILIGEDFTQYDDSQFTLHSLRGLNFPVMIWSGGGRFYPLGLQQFNLVSHFTRSIAGYHAFQIVEMLIFVAILLVLDEELSVAARVVLAGMALLLPGVAISFSDLIYQECDVVFWLACMALSVKKFTQTQSPWWAVFAVLSAQIALYYKEPVFVLLLAFAAIRIFLRGRVAGGLRKTLRDPETRLDLMIAAVSLVFAGLYAITILPGTTLTYLTERRVPRLEVIGAYLRWDVLIWIFAVFTMIRMYRVLRGAVTPLLLWDGLACGGLAYFGAYLGMRMFREYFLAPADVIALLYMGRFVYRSWGTMATPLRVATAALGLVIVFQNLDHTSLRVLERKWFTQGKRQIAGVILDRYQREQESVLKLYFPVTLPYAVSEYAAYLSYRGLPVEGDRAASQGKPGVELYAGEITQTGRCVVWQAFVCHAGPASGESLTVVMPDDPIPDGKWEQYHRPEVVAAHPRSRAQHWLFQTLQFFYDAHRACALL